MADMQLLVVLFYGQMRILLFGLFFIWLTACTSKERIYYPSGQIRNELIGTYAQSSFMYSYTLILQDSSKYVTVEKSDIFTERTIGTWTIRGQAIRLTPQKKINTTTSDRVVQEELITESKEEVVIIETTKTLIITNRNPYLTLNRAK